MSSSRDKAFSDLVAKHGDQLLRYARLLVPDATQAEDVLQVALMRLYRRWTRVETPVAYVRATLVNLVKDEARRSHLVPPPISSEAPPGATRSAHPDLAEAVVAQARLDDVLRALPTRQRLTVILRVLDGLSEAETATLLECSPGTVKSNLSRGLQKLRSEFSANTDQPEAAL